MAAPDFYVPRRFHPGYSWLGRWLRRRTDRWQGEALHVMAMTFAGLGLLLIHYLSWTLLHTRFATSLTLTAIYWLSQLGLLGLIAAAGGVGFQPALAVYCRPNALHLQQGRHTLTVPYNTITSVEHVPMQRFHRHERRYAATQVFIGTQHDTVLLLHRTDGGPVAIGLATPDDQYTLAARLETTHAPSRTEDALL